MSRGFFLADDDVVASGGGSPVILLQDSFTGAGSVPLKDHTPEIGSYSAYADRHYNSQYTPVAGATDQVCTAGSTKRVTANNGILMEGAAAFTFQFKVPVPGRYAVGFRMNAASWTHGCFLGFGVAANTIRFYHSYADLNQYQQSAWTFGSNETIKIVDDGGSAAGSVKVYINDTLAFSNDAYHIPAGTGTDIGFAGYTSTRIFDDFLITTP